MSVRQFRSMESYRAERITRDMVAPFLRERGIDVVLDHRRAVGSGESQIVEAILPEGDSVRMRVRLCWRRDGRNPREHLYAAAQLRARTLEGDWTATLDHLVARDRKEGVTHTLLVQRDAMAIRFAALLPTDALPAIWHRQREISDALSAAGESGSRRKNHAANGDSPTLWLQDDRHPGASAVPDALWAWPGVRDLAQMPRVASSSDDTFDDLPGAAADAGSDNAPRIATVRSEVKRDRRVRSLVLQRSNGRCERAGCGQWRSYPGFLDVHHIVGVDKSDRVWNCVALCPNCHREAHYSPEAEAINTDLLALAARSLKDESEVTG